MFSVPYNSAGITSVLYSLPMDLHVLCPVQQCWYYQCPVQPPHGSSCSLSRTTVLVLRVSCTASPWIFMFSVPYNSAGITSVLYSLPMDLHVLCPVQQCWYYQCPVQPPHGSSCSLSPNTVLYSLPMDLHVLCPVQQCWYYECPVQPPHGSSCSLSPNTVLYSLPMDLHVLCPVQQCWYYECPVQPPHGSSCSLSPNTVLYSLPMDLHVLCPVQQCWYYQCPVQPPHGSSCSLSRTTVLVLPVSCTASPWIFNVSVPYNSAGITSVLYSLS